MLIEVTQADIDKGEASNCSECPVALAARRAFLSRNVSVNQVILCTNQDIYSLPKSARQFILDFDDGKPVKPFSFQIPD